MMKRKHFLGMTCGLGLVVGMVGVAQAQNLVWQGGVNGQWDVGVTANWTGDAVVFGNGAAVRFDDTAPGATAITVAGGGVLPSGVVVDNSALAYSIGGAGIGGAGSLSKLGTGALTLTGPNSYSGGTLLSGGTIRVGNGTALGTGQVTMGGGTLATSGTQTVGNAVLAQGATTSQLLDNVGGGDLIFTGAFTGTGTLALNSTVSRSLWFQGDMSGFGGTVQFTNNNNGTNLRLGGGPGTVQNNGTNGSDLSGTSLVLSGATGNNRGVSWNGVAGATVEIGALSGVGRLGLPNSRDANWEIGALGTNTTYSGTIEGATSRLTKVGTGNLTLLTPSSYGGGTTLTAGTLTVGNGAALGGGVITLAGGTLSATNGAQGLNNDIVVQGATTTQLLNNLTNVDLVLRGTLTGTGTLVLDSTQSRSLWLMGDGSGFGGTIEYTNNNNGTNLRLGGGPGTSQNNGTNGSDLSGTSLVLSGSTGNNRGVSWNGVAGATVEIGALSGVGRLGLPGGRDANWEIGALGTNTTYSGTIEGATSSLTKVGTGTLTLNGASSFGGAVVVEGGTLRIGNQLALGAHSVSAGKVTVLDGAAVDFGGVGDAVYGYTISGDGVGGTGALVNTGGGIGTNLRQASNITLAADASIGGTGNWALLTSGYGATTLDLAGNTLTKVGSNTFTLANATLTAGSIQIAGGTFTQIANNKPGGHDGSAVAFSLGNTAGATLDLGNLNLSVGSLAGGGAAGGNVVLGSGRLTVGALGSSTSFAGGISGTTGGLTKVGTGNLTLSGGLGYGGSTLVEGGTLTLAGTPGFPNAGSSGQFSVPAQITVGAGATLAVTGDWALGGGLTNQVHVDGGTLRFLNSDNYMGNIALTGGAIETIGGLRPWRTGNWGSGQITVNASAASSTMSGSLAFVGTGAAPRTAFTVADGAAAVDLQSNLVIFDHPGFEGQMVLVKEGAGLMQLSGASTWSGGTVVSGGTLVGSSSAAFGSGGITLGDAATGAQDVALLVANSADISNPITVSALGTGTATIGSFGPGLPGNNTGISGPIVLNRATTLQGTATDRTSYSGVISGNVGLLTVTGGARTVFEGAANTFVGDVALVGGGTILQIGVVSGATDQIPDASSIDLGAGTQLFLSSAAETINGLSGSGNVRPNSPAGGVAVLTVGAGGASSSFSGTINNNGGQVMALVKDGAGTLTLSGAGNATGGIRVAEGVVRLEGNRGFNAGYFSGVDNVPYVVESGGVLELAGDWITRSNSIYRVEGGTIRAQAPGGNVLYMNRIVFDGAAGLIEGPSGIRAGYFFDPSITVTASGSGSEISTLLNLLHQGGVTNSPNGMTLDVADGAAAADLTISGRLIADGTFGGLALTKVGGGRVVLGDPTNTFNGGVRINGGTLSVGHLSPGNTQGGLGAALGTSAFLSFDGGTLEYTGATVGGINRAFALNAGGGTISVTEASTTLTWTDAAGAGPITGIGQFTKDGEGTLVFAGNNNYSGGTVVREGTLVATNAGAFGSGAVVLNDAGTGAGDTALLLGAGFGLGNAVTVSADGTGTSVVGSTATSGVNPQFNGLLTLERDVVLQAGSSDRTTFRGQITGTGDVTVSSPFAGGRRVVFDRPGGGDAANDFVGDITLGPGAWLQLGVANPVGDRTVPDASRVYFADGNSRLRLAPGGGADGEVVGTLVSQAAGAGRVEKFTGGAFVLGVGGDGGDGEFSGSISQTAGSLAIEKVGAGTQVFSGASTYTGGTVVSEGTLLVNNTVGSGTGSGAVVVAQGARFGGSGITGPGAAGLTVLSGGTLAPGSSPGVLTVNGDVLMGAGAFFEVELAVGGSALPGDGVTGTDRLVVNGEVDLDGALLTGTWGGDLDNVFQGGVLDDAKRLWAIVNDGSDAIGGTFANSVAQPGLAGMFGDLSASPYFASVGGQAFALFYDADFASLGLSGGNDLLLVAIPEPGRAILLVLGLGLLIGRRKRG